MILSRSSACVAIGLVASLALSAVPAGAQDAIARAKILYQSADYDEALSVLDQLQEDPAATTTPEAAAYRMFCLLALGRGDEARQSVGAILRLDPRYLPSESEASPRIRAMFQEERRRLLPQIFQERYERAKASFERKEFKSAADQFNTLVSLIDDPALAGEESRADFRLVISGFGDLAKAALTAQAPPPAPPAASSSAAPSPASNPASGPPSTPAVSLPANAPAAPVGPRIYGANDKDVIPPVAVSKQIPSWRPNGVKLAHEYVGVLEVVVDERGNVAVARMQTSVYPFFDAQLIQAARRWTFRPAVKQGQPVSYRSFMQVKLAP